MTSSSREPSTKQSVAIGVTTFAGVMLAMLSLLQALQGLAAVLADDVFLTTPNYAFSLDLTAWGWIHLILGVIGVCTGIGILAAQDWARLLGLVIATLAVIANFMFLPYYPLWALVLITFGIVTIWALSTQLMND